MRYNTSQDAVASGEISCDQVLTEDSEDSSGGTVESSSGKQKLNYSLICLFYLHFLFLGMMDNTESGGGDDDGPLKADGTPDMRFSANQE